MSQDPRRLLYLDALRGIAAVSVVVFHYLLDMRDEGALSGVEAGFTSLVGDRIDLGKYGIVLFFLISGYIIPNSLGATGDRIGQFCTSRFFRLYPLYWLALAAGLFLPWPHLTTTFTPSDILANLTMIQGYVRHPDIIGSAWTLQIELTFYGFCVLLACMHRMQCPRTCAIMSAGFLCLAFLMAVARNLLVLKLPLALPLALSVMFFGTLWRQATWAGIPEAQRLASRLVLLIVAMMFPITIIDYNHNFGYDEHWQPYVTCYLLAIFTFLICTTRVLITWRPLVWLGEISYSIYLLHPLVASAAYRAGFVVERSPLDPLVYAISLVVVSVLCAWMTYSLVEQPFIAFGRRIIRARRGARILSRVAQVRTD